MYAYKHRAYAWRRPIVSYGILSGQGGKPGIIRTLHMYEVTVCAISKSYIKSKLVIESQKNMRLTYRRYAHENIVLLRVSMRAQAR